MKQDAVVECPEGMVFTPLEVIQGVPPLDTYDAVDDFVEAGCNSTTSSCVVREIPNVCLVTGKCEN